MHTYAYFKDCAQYSVYVSWKRTYIRSPLTYVLYKCVYPITPMTTLVISIDHYDHYDNHQIIMEIMYRNEITVNNSLHVILQYVFWHYTLKIRVTTSMMMMMNLLAHAMPDFIIWLIFLLSRCCHAHFNINS